MASNLFNPFVQIVNTYTAFTTFDRSRAHGADLSTIGQNSVLSGVCRKPVNALIAKVVTRAQRFSIFSPRLRRLMLNAVGAEIEKGAVIEKGCRLTGKIKMEKDSLINAFSFIDGSDWLIMEEGARIGIGSTVITRDHNITSKTMRRDLSAPDIVKPVIFRRGVTAGARCTFLPGVEIAEGCRIGSETLMTESTRPNGLYVNASPQGGGAVRGRRIKELAVEE
jgi:acetyltransferase-like isoleucine patch superfamily enzyme